MLTGRRASAGDEASDTIASFVAPGRIVFGRSGRAFAVAFD
jgi:hypothetical protein